MFLQLPDALPGDPPLKDAERDRDRPRPKQSQSATGNVLLKDDSKKEEVRVSVKQEIICVNSSNMVKDNIVLLTVENGFIFLCILSKLHFAQV